MLAWNKEIQFNSVRGRKFREIEKLIICFLISVKKVYKLPYKQAKSKTGNHGNHDEALN